MGLQTRFFCAPTETPSRPADSPGIDRIAVDRSLTALRVSLTGRPAGERKARRGSPLDESRESIPPARKACRPRLQKPRPRPERRLAVDQLADRLAVGQNGQWASRVIDERLLGVDSQVPVHGCPEVVGREWPIVGELTQAVG